MAEIVTTKPKPKKEKPPPIEIPPPPPLQPNGRHFMVFGWEFNARDLVGWANHNKVGVGAEDNHKRTLALRTIEKRFRDGLVVNHVIRIYATEGPLDTALCFAVGTNRTNEDLARAQDIVRVKKFQSVLRWREAPGWYRYAPDR